MTEVIEVTRDLLLVRRKTGEVEDPKDSPESETSGAHLLLKGANLSKALLAEWPHLALGSSTISMRKPKGVSARDLGWTKKTVVPREPGRGPLSIS